MDGRQREIYGKVHRIQMDKSDVTYQTTTKRAVYKTLLNGKTTRHSTKETKDI
jgi:hypothetical protein